MRRPKLRPTRWAWPAAAALSLSMTTPALGQSRAVPIGSAWNVFASGGSASSASSPAATVAGQRSPPGVRERVGAEVAERLMQSNDPDERLRGVERAAAMHTPEALALLERASRAGLPATADVRPPLEGIARKDPRALLAAVRGLGSFLDRDPARAALASILDGPTQSFETRPVDTRPRAPANADPSADDADGAARVLLARQEAAVLLAESGALLSLESLMAIARSAGPGQGPALDALAIHPPSPPVLGGVLLTTPATIGLAATVGDLRSIGAIEGALAASDPGLRAAALVALGAYGDSRAAEAARGVLGDRDARVRVAAAEALVRLAAGDAAHAVEKLIADDSTATEGLRLAPLVQDDGVTKAAAARAAVSARREVRAAAIAALGRQTSALAVDALAALSRVPAMQGDAACAIARSPSGAALPAVESMAGDAGARRVAARAYLVRRLERGEKSARLDALVAALSVSSDARDRAVGVEARVAFGELSAEAALHDGDASVRSAAAMGTRARWDAKDRAALLARVADEADPAARQALAVALLDGDTAGVVPTSDLEGRVRSGGPDAPAAALALARREKPDHDEVPRGSALDVDALLASHDPVLRAHVVRGLSASAARDAVERIARVYDSEGDVTVRRAIVEALAARDAPPDKAGTPSRRTRTLALAARIDPDRVVRSTASRALAGTPPVGGAPWATAWLRVVPAEGATLPRGMTGMLVQSDGRAVPIAFDDDGYAIVLGVPAGEAQLRLAPRLPPYDATTR
jgi:HEAT repeats